MISVVFDSISELAEFIASMKGTQPIDEWFDLGIAIRNASIDDSARRPMFSLNYVCKIESDRITMLLTE